MKLCARRSAGQWHQPLRWIAKRGRIHRQKLAAAGMLALACTVFVGIGESQDVVVSTRKQPGYQCVNLGERSAQTWYDEDLTIGGIAVRMTVSGSAQGNFDSTDHCSQTSRSLAQVLTCNSFDSAICHDFWRSLHGLWASCEYSSVHGRFSGSVRLDYRTHDDIANRAACISLTTTHSHFIASMARDNIRSILDSASWRFDVNGHQQGPSSLCSIYDSVPPFACHRTTLKHTLSRMATSVTAVLVVVLVWKGSGELVRRTRWRRLLLATRKRAVLKQKSPAAHMAVVPVERAHDHLMFRIGPDPSAVQAQHSAPAREGDQLDVPREV